MDKIGQVLQLGDTCVCVSSNTMYVGVLVKFTPKSHTICYGIGTHWNTKKPHPNLCSGRTKWNTIKVTGIPSRETEEKLNKIREYYGYTRDGVNG